jgi:hypothetical protein
VSGSVNANVKNAVQTHVVSGFCAESPYQFWGDAESASSQARATSCGAGNAIERV